MTPEPYTKESYQHGGKSHEDDGNSHQDSHGKDKWDDGSTVQTKTKNVTNEYVLNVAFWTFIGFTLLEAVFGFIAGSQSMLEDAEAMSVDALTYLFNLWAERIKHRPYSDEELKLPVAVREYQRELQRLYLELVPPLLSVMTLILVTGYALRDAFRTLIGSDDDDDGEDDDVDVSIMLIFSGMNLLLDVVNVACFARANQAFGLSIIERERAASRFSTRDGSGISEMEELLSNSIRESPEANSDNGHDMFINLNMCSAWTHVCADTMRSVAVLVAAIIAFLFDGVSGAVADSAAAVIVSIIILISLLPLIHGLIITARMIVSLSTDPTRPVM